MSTKYQIFISSTYEDLKEEREQVLKAVLRLGHIPIGMELFNAADETQWEMIKRRIEESDYYLVIIAHRYGSIDSETKSSYTEKEYDYATSLQVPTMAFVLDRSASWPSNRGESDPKMQKALKKFIAKVQKKMRDSWSNKDELASKVAYALTEMTTAHPQVGWVRANQVVSADTVNEMTALTKENRDLREELARLQKLPKNQIPMPDLELQVEIVQAQDIWYETIEQNYNPLGLTGLASLNREHTKEVTFEGLWLKVAVSNGGNLATDLSIKLSSTSSIISEQNIDLFNQKDLNAILGIRQTPKNGWQDAECDQADGSWEFTGFLSSLKPGQGYSFKLLPVSDELFMPKWVDATIQVDVFPSTGDYIGREFKVSDLISMTN